MSDANIPSHQINLKQEGMTNPEFVQPATPEEFLPPISSWTSMGGIALLVVFSGVIILASTLKYKITIKTPATIRPTGELRLVQAATEGTIKSITVKVNQVVKKGDIIAYIDNSRQKTILSQLQTNIQQSTQQLSQLDTQIRTLDMQIVAESDRTNRAIAITIAEQNRTQREIQEKKITTTAQLREAEANLKQTQKELQKTQIRLKSAQAQLKSAQAALKATKAKLNRYQPLAKIGSISVDQLQEAQLASEQQEQLLESQKAIVEEHHETIKQQKQAVEAAEARRQVVLATIILAVLLWLYQRRKLPKKQLLLKSALLS